MLASDVPSTSMATTVATGIRNPRMHGTRPICFWFTVIRVNLIVLAPGCPRQPILPRQQQHPPGVSPRRR